jgi:hypothetical protein
MVPKLSVSVRVAFVILLKLVILNLFQDNKTPSLVILNLFQDNEMPLLVILKLFQDTEMPSGLILNLFVLCTPLAPG